MTFLLFAQRTEGRFNIPPGLEENKMIDVEIETLEQVIVVKMIGEIDAGSAAIVQQRILPLSGPGCKIILDLSKVAYMSSAGLRMLLSVYRQISGNQGKIVLVGLSEELTDTMSMTGFLGFFTVQDTIQTGLLQFG
jgi:anti-sigma B factor antagonist